MSACPGTLTAALVAGALASGNPFFSDLIALNTNGNAFLYSANDQDRFDPGIKIIDNWSHYVKIVGGQFNGTGGDDVIAIDKAGKKWLHANVNGNFGERVQLTN